MPEPERPEHDQLTRLDPQVDVAQRRPGPSRVAVREAGELDRRLSGHSEARDSAGPDPVEAEREERRGRERRGQREGRGAGIDGDLRIGLVAG